MNVASCAAEMSNRSPAARPVRVQPEESARHRENEGEREQDRLRPAAAGQEHDPGEHEGTADDGNRRQREEEPEQSAGLPENEIQHTVIALEIAGLQPIGLSQPLHRAPAQVGDVTSIEKEEHGGNDGLGGGPDPNDEGRRPRRDHAHDGIRGEREGGPQSDVVRAQREGHRRRRNRYPAGRTPDERALERRECTREEEEHRGVTAQLRGQEDDRREKGEEGQERERRRRSEEKTRPPIGHPQKRRAEGDGKKAELPPDSHEPLPEVEQDEEERRVSVRQALDVDLAKVFGAGEAEVERLVEAHERLSRGENPRRKAEYDDQERGGIGTEQAPRSADRGPAQEVRAKSRGRG